MGERGDGSSAEWLESVLNAMTDFVLVKEPRSRLVWANDAFLQYYGLSHEELRNSVDAPHSDPDDTVQYVRDDHHVFSTGETLDVPAEAIASADGSLRYFHTIKSPVKDEQGRVTLTVGVSRPVLEPQRLALSDAERSTHKSSLAELRTLIQNIPLAVAMLDVKHRILCNSELWREVQTADHDYGVGVFFDVQFDDAAAISEMLRAAIDSGESQTLDAWSYRTRNGQEESARVDVRPWFLTTGLVGGTIVILQDITQLKRSERRLRVANDELTQFNYRVSHDLVAPLRTIRGRLSMCQDLLGADQDAVREQHTKMIESIELLGGLVRDLLSLARSDVMEQEYEVINLSELVSRSLKNHADAIRDAQVTVRVGVSVQGVTTSRLRLAQILENLLSNAIKYHDPKKEKRWVEVRAKVSPGKELPLAIEVVDNGIGIPEEMSERMFDIFVRGGSKHPGSGLGLYLVKKHVERLGGIATIVTQNGETTARLKLPMPKTDSAGLTQ